LIDGEFKLCFKFADKVYDDPMGVKSVKAKLFFSNEYYTLNDTKKVSSGVETGNGLNAEQMKQAATEGHF
jgi:hypothetical protein